MKGLNDMGCHGVVSRRELLAAGISSSGIEHAVAHGRLHRVHRGVYAVGRPDLPLAGMRRAAVLACGADAVLSHRSAAGAWGIRALDGASWEVTVRSTTRRAPSPSIAVCRHRLSDDEITELDGTPITTVARTLLDLAGVVRAHELRRAVEAADRLELFDLVEVEHVLTAHPRRRGRRALVALLDDARLHGLPTTRSDAEAALLQICLDHGLPRPQVNHYNNGREVDFRWPDHGLVVEIDGWQHHRGRAAFIRDRARDRRLLREGERVARFTAVDVLGSPDTTARELAALLRSATRVGSTPRARA